MPKRKRSTVIKRTKSKITKNKYLEPLFIDWRLVETVKDGNCGPDAICYALQKGISDSAKCIEEMRALVANQVTEENFENKREALLYQAFDKYDIGVIETAENHIRLQEYLGSKEYFLNNDDISMIGKELGIFVVIINQAYNPNDYASDMLVLVNPYLDTDKHFLDLLNEEKNGNTSSGSKVKIVLLYNEQRPAFHYKLVAKQISRLSYQYINDFDDLPSQLQDFIQGLYDGAHGVDANAAVGLGTSPSGSGTIQGAGSAAPAIKYGSKEWARRMAECTGSWLKANADGGDGSCSSHHFGVEGGWAK